MAAKKKTTSTGSPTLDAANAAKKFKAPKDYKPLTTAQKVAMAASLVGPGKVVKGAKMVKDEIVMAKAGWNAAAKAGYRADVKRGTYAAQMQAYKAKVTIPAKKVVAAAKEESFKVKSNIHPNLHHKVSKDVSIKPSSAMKKENALFGKTSGAIQASKQNARLTKPISKAEAKANARALKAANKPTRASKTPIGNNDKIAVEVRRGVLKNTPPARPNRVRGGSLKTLKKSK